MKKLPSEPLRLNGQELRGTSREFSLRTEPKDANKKNVKFWGLFANPNDVTDEQKKFVKEAYVPSAANLEGEKFSLHFEDYSINQLKHAEIRVNVFDEKNVLKAYHYTSLKNLHIASKKGKNTWLSLSTNDDTDIKLPLLHLKIETRMIRTKQERQLLASRAGGFAKVAETGVVEDTFYNYSFKVPTVTPDQKEFVDLLPPSWKIVDQKVQDLDKTQNQVDFVQRIKYRLVKHYHETTTRQIARLRKSTYLWAQLQDDITSYFPSKKTGDRSQLYVNEDYLQSVTQGGVSTTQKRPNNLVSYLFKRDLWENNLEWRRFYIELERLCKNGIPPQNRLEVWSEMSRVIYFIRLTEEYCLNTQDLQKTGAGLQSRIQAEDDMAIKSRAVYETIKEIAQKNYSYLYQELEDDIGLLRESFGVKKLPYEKNIRNICRVFIYWSKVFSDPKKKENEKYFITYSRTIATLCYGFLVCQTCTFLEGNTQPDEHQVFWLLLSLATYILSSYFETNEHSVGVDKLNFGQKEDLTRRRNTLVDSALRCNHMKGIKSDLLLLKFLLKDHEPEIFNKFEELGHPLEYYFADYMVSIFFTLFNPGMTFRIWDVLFFEGSSANQVNTVLMS